MAQSLPPPATIRKAIAASLFLTAVGIAIAFVPQVRSAGIALAIIFAAFAALGFRNLRRAERPTVVVPPPADEARMVSVLASLGIPLSFEASDAHSALTSGAAKAAIFRGHELLMAGKFVEAIAALESAIRLTSDDAVKAVAHDLIARAKMRALD